MAKLFKSDFYAFKQAVVENGIAWDNGDPMPESQFSRYIGASDGCAIARSNGYGIAYYATIAMARYRDDVNHIGDGRLWYSYDKQDTLVEIKARCKKRLTVKNRR